jgi:uncharacterized protein YoaH (UPF0181 family)
LADDVTIRVGAEVSDAVNKILGLRTDYLNFAASYTRANQEAAKSVNSLFGDDIKRRAEQWMQTVQQLGGVTRLTTKEQAAGNDILTEALAKYKALGDGVPREMAKMAAATAGASKENSSFFDQFFFRMAGAATVAGLLANAVTGAFNLITTGVKTAFTTVIDLIDAGSKLQNLERSFKGLTAATGEMAKSFLGEARTGTHGLISDFDLMQSANRAMLFGIKTSGKEFGQLGNAAIVLGRAMGISATKSLDDLVLAIGRVSPRILDNLGIIVKVTEANKNWADANHRTKDSMTASERTQAFYEESLRKINAHLEAMGPIQLTMSDHIEIMRIRMSNAIYGPGGLADWLSRNQSLAYGLTQISGLILMAFGGSQEKSIRRVVDAVEDIAIGLVQAAQVAVDFGKIATMAWSSLKIVGDSVGLGITMVLQGILWAVTKISEIASKTPLIGDAYAKNLPALYAANDALKERQKSLEGNIEASKRDFAGTSEWGKGLELTGKTLKQLEGNMRSLKGQRIEDNEEIKKAIKHKKDENEIDEIGVAAKKKTEKAIKANSVELAALSAALQMAERNHVPLNVVTAEYGARIKNAVREAEIFGHKVPEIVRETADIIIENATKQAKAIKTNKDELNNLAIALQTAADNHAPLIDVTKEYGTRLANVVREAHIFGHEIPIIVQEAARAVQEAKFDEAIQKAMDGMRAEEVKQFDAMISTAKAKTKEMGGSYDQLAGVAITAWADIRRAGQSELQNQLADVDEKIGKERIKLGATPEMYRDAYSKATVLIRKEFDKKQLDLDADRKKELDALSKLPGAYGEKYQEAVDAVNAKYDQKQLAFEAQLAKELAALGPIPGAYAEAYRRAADAVEEQARRMKKAINDAAIKEGLNNISSSLIGIGQVVGGTTEKWMTFGGNVVGSISKMDDSSKSLKQGWHEATKEGGNLVAGMGMMAVGALEGVQAINQATSSGNRLTNALGGAAAGAKLGASFAGPWGAAVGAGIGAIIGAFRGKPEWMQIMEQVGKEWGTTISQELAKAIEKDSKRIGDTVAATLLHLGDIVKEAGGITADNVEMFTGKTRDLFVMLENKTLTTKEVVGQLNAVFPQLAKVITDSNGLAGKSFLELIALNERFGTKSAEVAAFIKGQITNQIIPGLNEWTSVFAGAADRQTSITQEMTKVQGELAKARTADEKKEINARLVALQQSLGEAQSIIKATSVQTQVQATGLTEAVAVTFQKLRSEGMSTGEAIKLLMPTIQSLQTQLGEAGFEGSAAFNEITAMANLAQDKIAGPVLQSVDGLDKAMRGLHNSGLMNDTMFQALSSQVTQAFTELKNQGKDGDAVLRSMQPTLQMLWEEQQKFGRTVDDTTQDMLNQAVQSGVVGSQYMSTNDKMLAATERMATAVEGLARKFGVDLPAATDEMARRATGASDTVTGKLQGSLNPAVGAVDLSLRQTPWEIYQNRAMNAASNAAGSLAGIGGAVGNVGGQLERNIGAWDRWENEARGSAGAVRREVDGISFGSSPGGIQQWFSMLRSAGSQFQIFSNTAIPKLQEVKKAVNAIGDLSTDLSLNADLSIKRSNNGVPPDVVAAGMNRGVTVIANVDAKGAVFESEEVLRRYARITGDQIAAEYLRKAKVPGAV